MGSNAPAAHSQLNPTKHNSTGSSAARFMHLLSSVVGSAMLVESQDPAFVALQNLSPDILKSASRIYGASSGSIIATLVLCDCDLEEIKLFFFNTVEISSLGHFPGGKVLKILRDSLNKYLPTNAHELVSGKLHVIVTRVHDWRSVAISEFASKEDLIQAIMCSCFIPLYFGFFPPTYHGVRYVDGELGMWRANFTSRTTITVSAFAGEYDICPKDSPAAFFNFQLSDCILQISKINICRLQYIFQLPTYQVLDQFYIHGYQDTVSFLKRLSDFGVNYLDEDFMLSLGNESCQKGERTLRWKPETRLLCSRATDLEDVTEENPGTIRAADEVEEEVPHHLLHRQKGPCQLQKSISDPAAPFDPSSFFKEKKSIWQPSLQTDTKLH
ncbi:omega-hydroxyceramide transacylase-like isoform X2 [Falco cherrug]|nr:omega-hydroxyceramide transacylase-like isoform X2 [Falco cherrug]